MVHGGCGIGERRVSGAHRMLPVLVCMVLLILDNSTSVDLRPTALVTGEVPLLHTGVSG
jgi:hypothetical protein